MSNFKVIEIVNANIIRVSPQWKFVPYQEEFVDDRVKIQGFHNSPDDTAVIGRLKSLLLDKEVELLNPTLFPFLVDKTIVECNVMLDNTDVTYFFPEYANSGDQWS